jgi:hypothetical protein
MKTSYSLLAAFCAFTLSTPQALLPTGSSKLQVATERDLSGPFIALHNGIEQTDQVSVKEVDPLSLKTLEYSINENPDGFQLVQVTLQNNTKECIERTGFDLRRSIYPTSQPIKCATAYKYNRYRRIFEYISNINTPEYKQYLKELKIVQSDNAKPKSIAQSFNAATNKNSPLHNYKMDFYLRYNVFPKIQQSLTIDSVTRNQNTLGAMYLYGLGTRRNIEAAHNQFSAAYVKLNYLNAADQAKLLLRLGILYITENAKLKDPTSSYLLLAQAQSKVDYLEPKEQATLLLFLGRMFARGYGAPFNATKGLNLLLQAYEVIDNLEPGGQASLCLFLGQMYLKGIGVKPNPSTALKIFEQARSGYKFLSPSDRLDLKKYTESAYYKKYINNCNNVDEDHDKAKMLAKNRTVLQDCIKKALTINKNEIELKRCHGNVINHNAALARFKFTPDSSFSNYFD